jgi:hypothetical protein
MKKIIEELDRDENFHFPYSADVYKEIQEQQEIDKKTVVKKFLKEFVRTEIDIAIKDGSTFVCVDYFKQNLSPELQEIVFSFLESRGYKIIDRNFEYGDSLRFEVVF